MKAFITLFSISIATLLLAGCGQKGPLYLPHTPTTQKERMHSRPLPSSYTKHNIEHRLYPPHHHIAS